MRWLWIDRFVEFRSGQFARAVKNVSMAEEQLRDHFPGYPVMPNSLIIEGMAQTGGILISEAQKYEHLVVLAKLARVEFTDSALPGDQLSYEATVKDLRPEGSAIEAKAFVNGRPLATAEIFFGHVNRSGSSKALEDRFESFRSELLHVLQVPTSREPAQASEPPAEKPAGPRNDE
jgi:3-hydroxyacyl-[acyl-carrier-protein] dehydratase